MVGKTEQQNPPADPAAGDPEAGRVQSIGEQIAAAKNDILSEVRSLIGSVKDGGSAQSAAEQHEGDKLGRPSKSLDQMVADAIKVNDEARARDAKDKDAADRLARVEAATAERPPVDRRRVHRFMGWGDPAQ